MQKKQIKNKQPSKVFTQQTAISRIQLSLISPEDRLMQLMRVLPNGSIVGQITNSKTLNYRTLKPEKGGFFCERIFGPTKNFICACGKKQRQQIQYCPQCEVEYTSSVVRRYRLGFIRLGLPIAHIWFLKGRPSYISLLLDMKKKHTEAIAYGKHSILNNFSPDFGKRIPKLRLEYNQNFSDLRKQIRKRPGFCQLMGQIPFELRLRYQFLKYKVADDFWAQPSRPDSYGPYTYEWRKKHFEIKKPFYQFPMIRDRFDFHPYEDLRPDILYNLESYFFSLSRNFGSYPISKYQKIIPNSMVCSHSFEQMDYLLTGGLAFIHLFSKIDCYRYQLTFFHEFQYIRNTFRFMKRLERKRPHSKQNLLLFKTLSQQISKNARRFKLLRTFFRTGSRPEWMFISVLPILPPDLRPIMKMSNDQLAISDLNRLYQSVFRRNRNLKTAITSIFLHLGIDFQTIEDVIDFSYGYKAYRFSTNIIAFHIRLLQQSVDALLENGKGGTPPICGSNNRPLKSLSDILKGKKGRFRQNLLGKRVDYSGRSVIVVGPTLQLYQCGLPKQIAVELFQSLLIRKMLVLKMAGSVMTAKQFIQQGHPMIWPILNEIMLSYPVILNRAPTLHRLGVQAFLPKLVRGKAVLLHPLVCSAFNADFDGDQMGIHLPLSIEAKSEAWSLMLATQNMLSPATGEPILTPSQDMVLGCYYLTTSLPKRKQKQNSYFHDFNDVYKAYFNKHCKVHDFIWLKWSDKKYYSDQKQIQMLEIRLKRFKKRVHETILITSNMHQTYENVSFEQMKNQYIRTTVGRVLFNQEFQQQVHFERIQYKI